jgi:transcriptional regulator with XRE-family HTH domain
MAGRTKNPRRSALAVRLGASIREARERKDLTQETLAEHASLSKNAVGNIERGEFNVTVDTLKRLATALNCRAADLLVAADI